MKTKSREGAKAAREAFWQAALQHWAATHEKERLEMTLKFASIHSTACDGATPGRQCRLRTKRLSESESLDV